MICNRKEERKLNWPTSFCLFFLSCFLFSFLLCLVIVTSICFFLSCSLYLLFLISFIFPALQSPFFIYFFSSFIAFFLFSCLYSSILTVSLLIHSSLFPILSSYLHGCSRSLDAQLQPDPTATPSVSTAPSNCLNVYQATSWTLFRITACGNLDHGTFFLLTCHATNVKTDVMSVKKL